MKKTEPFALRNVNEEYCISCSRLNHIRLQLVK